MKKVYGQEKKWIVEDSPGETNANRESAVENYLFFNPGGMFKREDKHSEATPESGG